MQIKAAIVIDSWKLSIFERNLTAAGYGYDKCSGLTADTRILTITTENVVALGEVVKSANEEAAATGPREAPPPPPPQGPPTRMIREGVEIVEPPSSAAATAASAGPSPDSRPSGEQATRAQGKTPERPSVTLTDGSPVTEDHRKIDPATGMQKGYVILSEEERAKGFVRSVRRSYVHDVCHTLTTMGQGLAETYARDPSFYSGTYCAFCKAHYPVGADGEFTWADSLEKVGT